MDNRVSEQVWKLKTIKRMGEQKIFLTRDRGGRRQGKVRGTESVVLQTVGIYFHFRI